MRPYLRPPNVYYHVAPLRAKDSLIACFLLAFLLLSVTTAVTTSILGQHVPCDSPSTHPIWQWNHRISSSAAHEAMLSPRRLHSFTTWTDVFCHGSLSPHGNHGISSSVHHKAIVNSPTMCSVRTDVDALAASASISTFSPQALFSFLPFSYIELRLDTAAPTLTQVPYEPWLSRT